MKRVEQERKYWDEAAKDPDVDQKYIADVPTDVCMETIGTFAGNVLEIGCGVGRLMKPGYFGVDISENMLEIAQQRKPDCYFYLGDGRTLPFNERVFTAVYSMLVFQHLDAAGFQSYVKESARVLDDSGKFRFQFIEGDENEPFSHHYSLQTVTKWLNDAGFEVKEVERGIIHFQWTWILAVKNV